MQPRLVICASGEGTNFEAIVQATRSGLLAAEVAGLIVNREGTGAAQRAASLGVPVRTLIPKNFDDRSRWDGAMAEQLRQWGADWVVLAGFLTLVGGQVLRAFPGRVVNSHPALLPRFGGEGMYGDRVHAAVLAAGARETGVTVHLVDPEYDRGRILLAERVEVLPGDTVDTLSARVKACENRFYPRVLNDLVCGRITTG